MAASDGSVSGSDLDDIGFAPDGQALCLDNRGRRPKPINGGSKLSVCRRWSEWRFLWPLISMSITSVVVIGLIAALSRTCQMHAEDGDRSDAGRSASKAKHCPGFPWSETRLPKTITPLHYQLEIWPNLSERHFSGRVSVEFFVNQSTQTVIFHAKELSLDNIRLGNRRLVDWHQCDHQEQTALTLDRPYRPGETDRLSLSFRGNLSDGFRGLYRSSYKTSQNERRYLAVTQFEPTDARRMLPCWDEPAFKAEFSLSIIRQPNMISISNMPVQSTDVYEQHWRIDRFHRTLKMSTYLLALVVCDFSSVTQEARSGVEISVFAPSEQINQSSNALVVAVDALEYLENFFKIKYPLKKLDLIALADFSAGAMENWGLMTFRDNLVLFDPQKSSTQSEEAIATVVTHELAHQWFGNLVTMQWWSDLWLNEGFARFMENFVTSRIRPEWNLMSMFVADATTEALFLDGLNTTHAIFADVADPAEIESVFDVITYDKGAAIIYMLMTLAGEDRLTLGLHEYLTTYQYSNAEGHDLWSILTKHVPNLGGLTLTEVAKTWTTQPGYPVINLTYANGIVAVEQSRFMFLQEMREKYGNNQMWHVPVTVFTNVGPDKPVTYWLKNTRHGQFSLASGFSWLKANVNSTGLYRVLYDAANWKAIGKQLLDDHNVFTPSDRTLLLDDAFAFLRAGLLDVGTVFELLKYFPKESNYGPMEVVLGHLVNIEHQLLESKAYRQYRSFVASLLVGQYKRVGWTVPKGHENRLVQAGILSASCRFDVSDCKLRASNLFWDWRNNSIVISPDLLGLACAEALYKSDDAWNIIWNLYTNATVPSEKLTYLRSLGYSQHIWRLIQLLDMTLDPDSIRPNLMSMVGSQVAINPIGRLLVWRHLRWHWNDIIKLVETTSILGNLIKGTISYYNDAFDYNEFVEFFQNKELGGSKSTVYETLELVKINIQWMNLNEMSLKEWLDKQRF